MKNFFAIILIVLMIFAALPATASQDGLYIEFIDITGGYEKGVQALSGEAKILVRARGLEGDATIVQTAISFDGDLKYKGIQYLIGENNYPECIQYYPDAAYANFTGKIIPAIITNSEYTLKLDKEGTDLFILTFSGSPEEIIDVRLNISDSYCILGEDEHYPTESSLLSASASVSEIEKKTATVRLTMDKVTTFAQMSGSEYSNSNITLSITDEKDEYTLTTVLNNILKEDGGHRDGSKIVPSFEIVFDVIPGKTYAVKLSGPGYVSYEKSGVTFDAPLELTNSDFIPGDINGDKIVGADDKEICVQAVSDESVSQKYLWATDINRDGVVNDDDLLVFEGISADDDKEDDTDKDNNNKDDENKDTEDKDNKNDKDDDEDKKGSSHGGGGGGSGGGGGGSSFGGSAPVVTPTPTPQTSTNQTFADLVGYEWAQSAVYSLKNKGIINGTSATAYSPSHNIKRGDFILILTRMINMGEEDSQNFVDVPSESYYASAISKAKKAGIAKGSGNEFYPENSITRQDLITLAYRAFLDAGIISETTDYSSLDQFADKANIADYALAPLASMVASGIIKGSDGNVNPNGNATRAEVAVMCERLMNLKK